MLAIKGVSARSQPRKGSAFSFLNPQIKMGLVVLVEAGEDIALDIVNS